MRDVIRWTWGARPLLLDLYCGPGGASFGYWLAGFDLLGVDKDPQPHYPFAFIQADALDVLADPPPGVAAIGASPICQGHANVTAWRGDRAGWPDLLTPTLAALAAQPLPYVVENVPEAPIRADYLLCGTNFGLPVKRHRAFQIGNWAPGAYQLLPPCRCGRNPQLLAFGHKGERAFADAMGCTWVPKLAARQCIPPAYTHHIGGQLLARLGA